MPRSKYLLFLKMNMMNSIINFTLLEEFDKIKRSPKKIVAWVEENFVTRAEYEQLYNLCLFYKKESEMTLSPEHEEFKLFRCRMCGVLSPSKKCGNCNTIKIN